MLLPSGYSTRDYSVRASAKGWGAGWPTCEALNAGTVVVTAQRSGTKLYQVHPKLAPLAAYLINETERRGYRLRPGQCWGGQCRCISGTNRPSNHSWGLAFDFNAPDNPYTSSGQHDIPEWVFALWRAYGFGVGADYSGKKDWMHFEFMGTPADCAAMTLLAARNFAIGAIPKPPPPAIGRPLVSKRGRRKPGFPLARSTPPWFGIGGNTAPNYVRLWQQYLVDSGARIAVDGKFGPGTAAATKAWQQKWIGSAPNQADGRVGVRTWNRAGLRV